MPLLRHRRTTLAVLLVAAACTSDPEEAELPESAPRTQPVSGLHRVEGTAPPAVGPFPSVLIFEPEETAAALAPEKAAVLDQFGTAFLPPVLLARVGQTVLFKNSEDQMHNVRVLANVTGETQFNISTPMFAPPYEHVFDEPGVYDVICGIHSAMAAYVVIVSTPWAVVADDDGAFTLADVPTGNYRVTVWNVDPDRRSLRDIEVGIGSTDFSLDGVLR